ncbi:MAG: gp58-like family protein [Planctomycetaceae bacterium]|nr:gp58-like family protein [Planctomycetaceae bacterium]
MSCNSESGFYTRSRIISQQPLTYEGVLELFRETREQFRQAAEETKEIKRLFQESDRKFQETVEQMKAQTAETDRIIQAVARRQEKTDMQIERTSREVGSLGSRIGEIVENMVGGDIVGQFQTLNIAIKSLCRDKTFGTRGTSTSGQIDVFLENGDVVILVEVKTRLTEDSVREHLERLEKYRLYGNDKRRILGAVAGAVVSDDVAKFAYRQGLYVIVQSGEAVKIVPPPEGFVAKEW